MYLKVKGNEKEHGVYLIFAFFFVILILFQILRNQVYDKSYWNDINTIFFR